MYLIWIEGCYVIFSIKLEMRHPFVIYNVRMKYYKLDETHNKAACSLIDSANEDGCQFPIQNLPFAVVRLGDQAHIVTVIGEFLFDLHRASGDDSNFLEIDEEVRDALKEPTLNMLMGFDIDALLSLRQSLSHVLSQGSVCGDTVKKYLSPLSGAEFLLPFTVGDYTDFYSCYNHAFAVGKMFRPNAPLLPNYVHIPIGYHGRSSSIEVAPGTVRRPYGQLRPIKEGGDPTFEPSMKLDFELELGIVLSGGNKIGESIPIDKAEDTIFGYCLLNDWSARDIQNWEYQPLGPFLAKSFASTLSPFIVTSFALAPFRCPLERGADLPNVLPYLHNDQVMSHGMIDIDLEVYLQSKKMRDENAERIVISRSHSTETIWTPAQMVAHHTSNGCNLQAGDLFGSGTISGTTVQSAGSILEMTTGGKNPLDLGNGESRTFLEDHDTVTFGGKCEKENAKMIGFGELEGTILPAKR